MGGIDFRHRSFGKTINEAYDKAVEEAIDEHGNDPYNGTISTTGSFKDVTDEYNRSNMELDEFIGKKLQTCPKWHCFAVCRQRPVPNELKVKSQVENVVTPGTKKWVLRYVVYEGYNKMLKGFSTKGEAVKYAREYTEKHECDTRIEMEKVLDTGSSTVAKIHYKRSSKEKNGEWLFFGVASY